MPFSIPLGLHCRVAPGRGVVVGDGGDEVEVGVVSDGGGWFQIKSEAERTL
jgi:hypothetical protein